MRPSNTRFAIAVHALTLLGAIPSGLSSELIAGSARSNPVHVRRVLGVLREAGLVRSKPGVNGGWQLVGTSEETTLADVWRALQGDDPVLGLHGAAPECQVGRRIQSSLGDVARRAGDALEAELEQTTLAQLVEETAAVEFTGPPS